MLISFLSYAIVLAPAFINALKSFFLAKALVVVVPPIILLVVLSLNKTRGSPLEPLVVNIRYSPLNLRPILSKSFMNSLTSASLIEGLVTQSSKEVINFVLLTGGKSVSSKPHQYFYKVPGNRGYAFSYN